MCADFADMHLIGKFNKVICFLLCICVFSVNKCTWVILLKYKRDITITNAFQKFLDESNREPNKVLVNKGRE